MTGAPVDTVLITGAFGQVGKRCAEILLGRGRTVVATDLRNDTSVAVAKELAALASPGSLVVEYADLLDADAISNLVAEHRPGAIVHLAAMMSPPSYQNPRLARRINVEGTTNLVKAATALAESPLLLKASSAAVYGSRNPYRYPEPINPETPVNGGELGGPRRPRRVNQAAGPYVVRLQFHGSFLLFPAHRRHSAERRYPVCARARQSTS